jgi:hypothetical protein
MAEDGNQIPKIGNFDDEQIRRDQIKRDQRHRDANPIDDAIPEVAGAAGAPQGAVGGARAPKGAVGGAENPRGDLDTTRWMKAQMEVQTDAFLKANAALIANQGAATTAAEGQAASAAAQVPVLFYGSCKDGKSILPNAFLMELEARQTRHGWEPSMLLDYVNICLRGEAFQWYEGCFQWFGFDQDQGPAENYAAFKTAFKQHYGAEYELEMLLLMDKIIEFNRTDKTRRNPTIAATTVTKDDPAVIEAVKTKKKKGKEKGKGNVAATFVAATPRPSTNQCKFCDKAGHIESKCYTKQNLEKFRHKMVSAVDVKPERTVSGNGHW